MAAIDEAGVGEPDAELGAAVDEERGTVLISQPGDLVE